MIEHKVYFRNGYTETFEEKDRQFADAFDAWLNGSSKLRGWVVRLLDREYLVSFDAIDYMVVTLKG